MKTQIAAVLILGLATVADVASAQVVAQRPASAATNISANAVTVQNDRNVPVTVYLEYGDFDRRLGTVPAMQTATLPLPAVAADGMETIQIFVHPEGEVEDLATQELTLDPPGRLGVIVPPRGGMPWAPRDTMMQVIPPEELADATLTVDNPRDKPVTVFAEQGEFDVRLGQVPARSRVTLRFPKSVIGPDDSIQIFVHPEGGFDLASESLQVRPGQHLGLRVPLR